MKKYLIFSLLLIVACGPSEEEIQARLDNAVEQATSTTTSSSTTTYQGSFISISSPELVVNKTVLIFVGCIVTDVMKKFVFPRGKRNNSFFLKSYAKSSLLK